MGSDLSRAFPAREGNYGWWPWRATCPRAIPKVQAKGFAGFIARPIDYDHFASPMLKNLATKVGR